jgi:hypothetical protein
MISKGHLPDDQHSLAVLVFAGEGSASPSLHKVLLSPLRVASRLDPNAESSGFEASSGLSVDDSVDLLSPHLIPVYSTRTFFPEAERRSLLRSWLERLRESEQKAHSYSAAHSPNHDPDIKVASTPAPHSPKEAEGFDLLSIPNSERTLSPSPKTGQDEIYLLRNPPEAISIGLETTFVAIALWRMRLWEGDGWTVS